ncbi:CcdB family protein [Caulobacter sp. LARHSG274]
MRQFQVFANPSPASRAFAPFVIVLQSHYLPLETVVVAPIVVDATSLGLDIPVTIEGRDLHIAMSELANIPKAPLRRMVADLAAHEDDIRRALDRLFTGF